MSSPKRHQRNAVFYGRKSLRDFPSIQRKRRCATKTLYLRQRASSISKGDPHAGHRPSDLRGFSDGEPHSRPRGRGQFFQPLFRCAIPTGRIVISWYHVRGAPERIEASDIDGIFALEWT